MSDFVDGLFTKLQAERDRNAAHAAAALAATERVTVFAREWWDRFIVAVEEDIVAWNAKDLPHGQVIFTKEPLEATVFHPAAEARLTLAGTSVRWTARMGGSPQRTGNANDQTLFEFKEQDGQVRALKGRDPVSTKDAAESVLTTIFIHSYAG